MYGSKAVGLVGRRIAILSPASDFATNPTLCSLAESLLSEGAAVDVVMPRNSDFPSPDPRLKIYPWPSPYVLKWHLRANMPRRIFNHFKYRRDEYLHSRFRRECIERPYDLFVGVDQQGLLAAAGMRLHCETPIAYLSFEIMFERELTTPADIDRKRRERVACRDAELVIVQDRWRAQLLANENDIPSDRMFLLPVAPAALSAPVERRQVRERLGIPKGSRIVLHSGSFSDWTYGEELLANVGEWPEEFVLVIHGRGMSAVSAGLLKQAQGLRNVFAYVEPLSQQEYAELVAACDIGLCLYKPMSNNAYAGENLRTIGLSSGKFSCYARAGLPIVTVGQSCYAEIFAEHRCGENVGTVEEIPVALRRIVEDYDQYSREGKRLFRQRLDFAVHWPGLRERLLQVVNGRR
jgi:hypothetical protein